MRLPKRLLRRARADHYEPGVLNGPMFLVMPWPEDWKPEGPRARVGGRWMSAVRASRVLYVARHHRHVFYPKREHGWKQARMRDAIGRSLHRYDDIPF